VIVQNLTKDKSIVRLTNNLDERKLSKEQLYLMTENQIQLTLLKFNIKMKETLYEQNQNNLI